MSSCSTEVCGVGGWGGPKPGDPDNNVVLSAVPAYGGIDVSWTYPATNPFAVAHTLLYRGSSSNFSSAVQHAVVAGSFFYDKIDANARYYYWIQLVSVNGTVGGLVGPATALAKPTIERIIEDITGRIDDGALAGSLRGEIGKIALNYSELLDEIAARIAGNAAFSAALQDLRDGLIDSLALIHEEVITRTNGQDALAALVTTLAAANANTAALLESTRLVLVSADAALSLRIDSVNAALGALGSAVTNVEAAKIGYSVLSGTDTPFDGNQIHIVYPADAYPAAEYPHYAVNRYRIIDKVGVDLWNANPVTASTPLQWLVGLPLATAIRRVGVSGPDGGYASLENAFVAQQGLNGQFKAMYTVKLNVNGLVGGFGIYNTGATVEAGFDVDTFWVGRTQANKRKPFIVEGGTVYIDEAAINKLTFSKLRDEGGSFIVEGGKLKTNYIDTRGLLIRDLAGNVIFGAGVPLNASNVSGLGPFATQAKIYMGAVGDGRSSQLSVDGTDVFLLDFISKYQKISSGNIGVYMDTLAVKTAYIDDLAVVEGKIANLSVGTLKIAGNAVTIPWAIQMASPRTLSPGVETVVASLSVTVPHGMQAVAILSYQASNNSGAVSSGVACRAYANHIGSSFCYASTTLKSYESRSGSGQGSLGLGAGPHTFYLSATNLNGGTETVEIVGCSATIIGCMR